MGDSRRKRMLRAMIPAELERRGMAADSCRLTRDPRWREDPAMDPRDGIVPDDLLVYRKWLLHAGTWALAWTLKANGVFYSQPRGWKYAIDCIGPVPRG